MTAGSTPMIGMENVDRSSGAAALVAVLQAMTQAAVGGICGVAEIDDILMGQQPGDLPEDADPAGAGVKNADIIQVFPVHWIPSCHAKLSRMSLWYNDSTVEKK